MSFRFALILLLWPRLASAQVAFEDSFSGNIRPQWSASQLAISTTPAGGQKYLGPFAGESVQLNLTELPEHQLVRLSIDLLIIRSWDGNHPVEGPDIVYIYADDGRLIHGTSFSWTAPQAYPGFFSVHTAPAGTGARGRGTFGFSPDNGGSDGIFHIECILPHREAKLGFRFVATTKSAISDEAWGIINAKVTLENPAPPDAEALAAAWDELGSDDPAAAQAAVWKLVAGGEATVIMLSQKLGGETVADVELLNPGRASAPQPSDGFALADSNQRRIVLGAHALGVIGSDGAKDVLQGLQRQRLSR